MYFLYKSFFLVLIKFEIKYNMLKLIRRKEHFVYNWKKDMSAKVCNVFDFDNSTEMTIYCNKDSIITAVLAPKCER